MLAVHVQLSASTYTDLNISQASQVRRMLLNAGRLASHHYRVGQGCLYQKSRYGCRQYTLIYMRHAGHCA